MNLRSLFRLAPVVATFAFFAGCADLQEQLPPATTADAKIHPDGWVVPAASDFHGKHIRANGWDMTSCQQCHGALNSTNGGTSGVSCATCHSQPAGPNDCTTCHGGVNAAPPRDLDGATTVTSPGVGAHQFHMVTMTTGKLVQCAECHTVPAVTADSGHIDASLPAEVPMSGALVRTATTGVTPNPTYSFTNNTCGGTYCHGSFKNGNLTNAPTWNAPAGTGAACGTCHGNTAATTTAQKALPKTVANGGTHPNYTQCVWCHDQTVNASASIVDGSKHVDGTVQLYPYGGSVSCRKCHGSTNASPPVDLAGNTDVSSPGVGAHQAHRGAAGLADAVSCNECHISPSGLDYTGADGHMDGTPNAELNFGTLAKLATPGVMPNPSYSFTNRTCADAYCHGSFKNGNLTNAPVWNSPVGTGAACGTCHGNTAGATTAEKALPKTAANGGTHPNYTQCSMCHDQVVNASTDIIDLAKHIDGVNQIYPYGGTADCSHCHGSAANAAPPKDIAGNTTTTARGVGAHQMHLLASTARPVKCAECHTVPTSLDYSGADGHMEGTALAEVAMDDTLARTITTVGSTSTQIIPNPTYNPADQSCSNTYCHGTFDYGNPSNAPTWTNAASGNCGTCHGNPATGSPLPPSPHPSSSSAVNCQNCHTVSGQTAVATYNSTAGTWSITNAAKHINGLRNTFNTEGAY
jgi:predicted CxxxxCH...CXXCH cytochrome family protein